MTEAVLSIAQADTLYIKARAERNNAEAAVAKAETDLDEAQVRLANAKIAQSHAGQQVLDIVWADYEK